MKLMLLVIALYSMLFQYELNSPLMAKRSRLPHYMAKHYRPNLLEHVAAKRGLLDTRKDVSGYASVPDCDKIGWVVIATFQHPRTGRWGKPRRLLVADCSHPSDRPRHLREGLGIETDYATADRHGFAWNGSTGYGKTLAVIMGWER